MKLNHLTAQNFREMVIAGGKRLSENVDLINKLNVFPVPDGDTGTNMNMSFESGVKAVQQSNEEHVGRLAAQFSRGILMGARGNSGVILSQIFRGFSKAIEECETLDTVNFVKAFVGGVESAYNAVMKPVEGTILTVTRESAMAGDQAAHDTEDIIEIMEAIVQGATVSLDNTPEQLPVLKEVGVVDSGGKGLLTIYEGFLSALTGETPVDISYHTAPRDTSREMIHDMDENPVKMEDITYGYCTEIMVRLGEGPTANKDYDSDEFRQFLEDSGDSIVLIEDDDIVKLHIHTENPGAIMQRGVEFGELILIKVDNMREQIREIEADQAPEPRKDYAVIAVAAGEGVADLFRSVGVDIVIEGGQTMNPATEDFVKAIEKANADKVILLPNNKNILMATEQAAEVSEVPAVVVSTVSIPEGMTAMMVFDPNASLEDNQAEMTEMAKEVTTGQITYSIRDTEIDGIKIKENDFMGLINDDIVLAEKNLEDAFEKTLYQMLDEDTEIVTILVGEDGDLDFAQGVGDRLMDANDYMDVEVIDGKQPVYNYILAVE